MPIDYTTQRKQIQNQIAETLGQGKAGLPIQTQEISENLKNSRENFLNKAGSSVGPAFSESFNASIPEVSGNLESEADRQLAEQKFGSSRQRSQAIYEHALRMALEAGKDLQSATAFARQIQADEQARAFEAESAGRERTSKVESSNMADAYSANNSALQAAYRPQMDLNSALLRVLFGTGTAIATAKYMGKGKTPIAPNQRVPVAGESGNADFLQPDPYTKRYSSGTAGTGEDY